MADDAKAEDSAAQTPAKAKRVAVKKKVKPAAKPRKEAQAKPAKAAPKKAVKKSPAKSAAKPKIKKVSKAKKAAASDRRLPVRDMNDHGFVVGTESAFISDELVKGGSTRVEVMHRISGQLSAKTRKGNDKNVSSLISGILRKLYAKGYTIEATWRVVPSVSGSTAKRKTKGAKIVRKVVSRSKSSADTPAAVQ